MSKIIFVPVEPLEERYSGMVFDVLSPRCNLTINPGSGYSKITNGQFLDIAGTIRYKTEQLGIIAYMFKEGQIETGDIFLFGDIFFPGLESVKYMAELLGIRVSIAAFNHAGRADNMDFVRNLDKWADSSEQGWHDACDLILVGSEFHRQRVISYFRQPLHKVKNTGQPWSPEWCESVHKKGSLPKAPYIIWPHRLCHEKGMDVLYRFAMETAHQIVITSCGKKDKLCEQFAGMENVDYYFDLSKQQYYKILDQAKWYLSTARQETFGYTLQEALYYDCMIVAPNRACYNEFVPIMNLYDNEAEIDDTLELVDCAAPQPAGVLNNVDVIMDAVKSLI
jgi:glycosyltransferase involved in cell wall biosynthesis